MPEVATWSEGLKRRLGKLTARDGASGAVAGHLLRSLWPLVLLTAAITALILMFQWRDQSSYKALFGAREKVNAADMMSVLDGAGVPYRIHPDTGQVLVPDAQLGKARMLLASKGVTPSHPAGLELMEHNDPLGVSQFVQDVRFRRGLEGELAQSIMTLEAVESARVHLAIAKSSSFVVGNGEKSSAAVMLVVKPGRELGHEQIAAIINLVVGSVAGLDPQRVTVVDQSGELLSARVDLSDGFESAQGSDAARYYQDHARQGIRELLAPVVGDQNYHASVTAEVDNDRVQETHEQYGDSPKVTNESLREETDRDALALGVPGSLSNRPIAVAGAADRNASAPDAGANPATPPSPSAQKNSSTRQFAYDRNVTQISRSRGRLHKLSVAVVLNGAAAPNGHGTWTDAQLAGVEQVLRSGLGIDASRGDTLVVSALAFPKPVAMPPWWREPANLVDAGSWLAVAIGAVLAWLLIARPLLKIAKVRWAGVPVPAAQASLPGSAPAAPAAEREAKAGIPVSPLLENYELPPPGSPVDVMVEHLKVLAGKEPERVAEVVKQWVSKNVRDR